MGRATAERYKCLKILKHLVRQGLFARNSIFRTLLVASLALFISGIILWDSDFVSSAMGCGPIQRCTASRHHTFSDVKLLSEIESRLEQRLQRVASYSASSLWIAASPDNTAIEFEINIAGLSGWHKGLSRPSRVRPLTYDSIAYRIECGSCTELTHAIDNHFHILSDIVDGFVLYEQGFSSQATQKFLSALYCSGDDLAQYHSSASIGLNLLQAQPSCEPLEYLNADIGPLYYYGAMSLALSGYYEHSIGLFEKAIALEEEEPANWIGLAQTQLRWGGHEDDSDAAANFAEARARLTQLEETLPTEQRAFVAYNRGVIAELQGLHDEAAQHFEVALNEAEENSSDLYEILFALSRVRHQQGDPETAIVLMNRARTLFPDSPWPYLTLAKLNHENRSIAQEQLVQAKLHSSKEPYVYLTEAELCQIWGDFQCAKEAYQKAIQLHPQSGWLQEKLGDLYLNAAFETPEQFSEYLGNAIEAYVFSVTTLRPEDPWSHERYAYALLNNEEYEEAIVHYQQAIALSNQLYIMPRLYCNMAIAYQHLDDNEAAKAPIEKCERLSSK